MQLGAKLERTGIRATPVEWVVEQNPVPFEPAVAFMKMRARAISDAQAPELIWLIEHPPLYTAGTSAGAQDLIWPDRFPVHETGRGGQYTYHGPGQRVVYIMLNVRERGGDIREFVRTLEAWIISTLAEFDVHGVVRPGRVGVWVMRPDKGPEVEEKIAAIGLRVQRGVSLHGLSINVAPDLGHFAGIVPCGLPDHGVTSFKDLGVAARMSDVDAALLRTFEAQFGAGTQQPGVQSMLEDCLRKA